MKTIFKLRLALLAIGSLGEMAAQTPDPPKATYGFIRLANALAQGTGNVTLEVDGTNVSPSGYKMGDVTGGIRLKPGTHNVKISRDGVKEGTTKVIVALDDTTILIPFAEKVPASDTQPAHWEVRILRLKQQQVETGLSGTFVSVSQNPEIRVDLRDPKGNWTPVFVKRLATTQAPLLYPRGYVPLKSGGISLDPIPVSENGNYVVLLYDDEAGKLRTLNFRDVKFLSAD
jgi:hypothetical protein